MLSIRSPRDVIVGTAIVTVLAILVILLHVRVNYPPEMRSLVRTKALLITGLGCFCIVPTVFWQLMKNYLLTERLKVLLNRDRLTDVATRDFFFAQMEMAPDAYGVSLMVDIDHFKRVNDQFGHPAGDKVICAVAATLSANIRSEDIVCRFGGEEFVIFLHEQDQEEGYAVAERMRSEIAQMEIISRDHPITVTVSIGGSLKQRVQDISWAIQVADDALYRAKNGGRNQTVFGPGKVISTPTQQSLAG